MIGGQALIKVLSLGVLLLLLTFQASWSQQRTPSAPALRPEEVEALPVVHLGLSAPGSQPIAGLPSPMMDGPARCSGEGVAFFQFWTGAPRYDTKEVFSVTRDGKATAFRTSSFSEINRAQIISFDPGTSEGVALINGMPAPSAAQTTPQREFFVYLALFGYDGKASEASKLELGFRPQQVAQVSENSFLVLGSDTVNLRPALALVDGAGTMLRRIDVDDLLPTGAGLSEIVSSRSFAGMSPESLPPAMQMNVAMSLFRFSHMANKLLLLQPGPHPKVIEFSASGLSETLQIKLPAGKLADSILPDPSRLLIRTYSKTNDNDSSLFEIDPDSGDAVREIRIAAPATTLACSSKEGFYGLQWKDEKPYIVISENH